MERDSLSYFLHRMHDIRNMYLDVIESGSTAMLSAVIEQQQLKSLPTISDRDIQMMQWVVKKMPVRNSKVATREFLSFLIQLKGATEARQLKDFEEWVNDFTEMMERNWLFQFEQYGNTEDAKRNVTAHMSCAAESETFKDIINNSYIKAKRKWAHQNHPG